MPAIGITGGISTGKSTFCDCLREILPAAKFFDADAVARQLVDLEEIKQELLAKCGFGIFSRNGDLNRAALRTIIFQDAAKKQALEQILHPRIRRQWSVEADRHRTSPKFFFADIPLLYETGGETLCDRVVVVSCSEKMQLARLKKRMSITATEARKMIESQVSLKEKMKRAHHVVWNNGERAVLIEQARFSVALWQG